MRCRLLSFAAMRYLCQRNLICFTHCCHLSCNQVLQDGSWKEMNEAEVIILDGARLVKQKRARWKKENDAISITRRAMGLEANSKNKSLVTCCSL